MEYFVKRMFRSEVQRKLQSSTGPIVAAMDYVCAVPKSVRAFLPGGFAGLLLRGCGERCESRFGAGGRIRRSISASMGD